MNIVDNAYHLALKWHEGQMYGNEPYVTHLADVVRSLYSVHGEDADPVVIATAWLHDILEDTDCPDSELFMACGPDVTCSVIYLTKFDNESREEYIDTLKADPIALEVKKHDTLANLTASVRSGEGGRIRKYAQQMLLLVD